MILRFRMCQPSSGTTSRQLIKHHEAAFHQWKRDLRIRKEYFVGRTDLTDEFVDRCNVQDFAEDVMAHSTYGRSANEIDTVCEMSERVPSAVQNRVKTWFNRIPRENDEPLRKDVAGIVVVISNRRHAADCNISAASSRVTIPKLPAPSLRDHGIGRNLCRDSSRKTRDR